MELRETLCWWLCTFETTRRNQPKEGLGVMIFVNSGRTFRCVMGYNEGPCGGHKDGATEGKIFDGEEHEDVNLPLLSGQLAKLSTCSQQHENPLFSGRLSSL